MNGSGRPLRQGSAHGRTGAVGSASGLGAQILGLPLEVPVGSGTPRATTTKEEEPLPSWFVLVPTRCCPATCLAMASAFSGDEARVI